MTNLLILKPSNCLVQSNTPFRLDSPDTLWLVTSGSMAVFAVTTVNGTLQSARRYLFEVKFGEALFSVVSRLEGQSHTLVAVAYEPVSLLTIPLNQWTPDATLNGHQIIPMQGLLQQWSDRLVDLFQDTGIGIEPYRDTSPTTAASLLDGIDRFHTDFLGCLHQLNQQETVERATHFNNRQQLNTKATEQAVKHLTSLFRPKDAEFSEDGAPLLIAAGAVGKALGIQICPPAKSEDLARVKDPLDAIARASRIRTRRVLLSGPWWKSDGGPLLGYTAEGNRPVALLPDRTSHYEIFDPEQQQRLPLTEQTARQLAPFAHMFYRPLPEKALQSMDVLQFIFRGHWGDVIKIVVLGVAATVIGMLTPQVTGILIDKAIPDADRGLLFQLAMGLLAVTFGSTVFEVAQSYATARIQTFMDAQTQAAVWDRLLRLRASFFRQYSTGDLQSRVSAINQIRQLLGVGVLQTLFSSIFSLLNLGLLFVYNVQFALVAVGISVISIVVTISFAMISRRQLMKMSSMQGMQLGLEVQLINGVSKIRVAAAEERAFAFWAKSYGASTQYSQGIQAIRNWVTLFNTVMSRISSIAIYWLAVDVLSSAQAAAQTADAAPAAESVMSIGTFLAFNTAYGSFIHGATSLSNTIISLLDVPIKWRRAQPILKELPEVSAGKADPGQLQGGVKLDRISFRYRQEGVLTLDRVTIEAEPGEFIAIVGPSGSGKSTLVRLLLGFESPFQGTVFYDGQDLSGLDVSAIRRQLGVVLQNGQINSASIFENISGGALITMDEAWEAASMAGFIEDIEKMPMGMHTVVSEGGTNISGGQRQRLAIARALVLKPKILIFDEATSALDNRTQAIVSQSLEQLKVTRIVIAHRLSTIRNANRIYVLAAGRLVQQGTFDELIKQEGLFANLMARQIA